MKPFKEEKLSVPSSDNSPPQRPKRNTCQKNLDVNNGLLWREETDLKRALYASLQETRRRNFDGEDEENPEEGEKPEGPDVISNGSSQEESPKKAKVHAQRKFAQGSAPNSPVLTPHKVPYANNSTTELLPCRRPKTEDFLTFLCLRGTSILPPSLDFLNTCSKSDTSSERSISPDIEIRELSNAKEGNFDVKEKTNTKCENGDLGFSRKVLSRKQTETVENYSKRHLVNPSKIGREGTVVRKRKSREDYGIDEEFFPSKQSLSRAKNAQVSGGTRTRSTALHALCEKYKKKRIAADKKKVLPAKHLKSVSSNNDKMKLVTRSQTLRKKPVSQVLSKNSVNKKFSRSVTRSRNRSDLGKRRSLRSSNPEISLASKECLNRRVSLLTKKTPWLRRAKLVPPIVDIDSDDDVEVSKKNSGSLRKDLSPSRDRKSGHSNSDSKSSPEIIAERLRTRHKIFSRTRRRIIKPVLNQQFPIRHAVKKTFLHRKNIKSKAISRTNMKKDALKRIKKCVVVLKTMSLRKDHQNKRVTRSAKHQIQEMLWSNPEKRTRTQSVKSVSLRGDTKQLQNEVPVKKKPVITASNTEDVKLKKDVERRKRRSISTEGTSKLPKLIVDNAHSELEKSHNKLNSASKDRAKSNIQENEKIKCNDQDKDNKIKIGLVEKEQNIHFSRKELGVTAVCRKSDKHTKGVLYFDEKPCVVSLPKIPQHFNPVKLKNLTFSGTAELQVLVKNELLTTSDIVKPVSSTSTAGNDVPLSISSDPSSQAGSLEKSKTITKNVYKNDDSIDCKYIAQDTPLSLYKIANSSDVVDKLDTKVINIDLTSSDEDDMVLSMLCQVKREGGKSISKLDSMAGRKIHKSSENAVDNKSHLKKEALKSGNSKDKKHDKRSIKKNDKEGGRSPKKHIDSKHKTHKKELLKSSKKDSLASRADSIKHSAPTPSLICDDSALKSEKQLVSFEKVACSNVGSSEHLSTLQTEFKTDVSQIPKPESAIDCLINTCDFLKDLKPNRKDLDKDLCKSKKESDSHKLKKEFPKERKKDSDKDGIKNKPCDKDIAKNSKKEEKWNKKDPDKSLAKLLKKERSKLSKREERERSKHKRDGSSSSKSSKREFEKDGSKLSKKDTEKENSQSEKIDDSFCEILELKKDKSSKKESSKSSRRNSYDEIKSPSKKKKKHDSTDYEKIKNLINSSSILNEFSGLKGFKRRSSSEKHVSKSKKRKKLTVLKDKKLSKKLSSKLLRKYSKKKGFKSKKNKLKKKELKKEMTNTDPFNLSEKSHSKSKKQKHKNKGTHRRDSQDKSKSSDASMDTKVEDTNVEKIDCDLVITVPSLNVDPNIPEKKVITTCESTTNTTPYNVDNSPSVCVPGSTSENTPCIDAVSATVITQIVPNGVVLIPSNEIHDLVSKEFSNAVDDAFSSGPVVLASQDTLSQMPLFLHDVAAPKMMTDAATNTNEDDIDVINPIIEIFRNEEMSVGTQTVTPVGSPSPTVEMKSIVCPAIPFQPKPVLQQSIPIPIPKEQPILAVTSTLPKPTQCAVSQTSLPVKTKKKYVTFPKKSKGSGCNSQSKLKPFPETIAKLVDAPVYFPTLEEFRDPLEYICKIQPEAEKYGICKIVPPSSFKPECKVNDDMRFTAHNQYVHKMLYRWGPNVQHVACIKKHLKSQKVQLEQAPLIGGIELDISKFYHTVQQFGGLQQVIEKKKWQKVADVMHIPRTAQDRVTKLYDAYCKYLVSYDTLPIEEKNKLLQDVLSDHEKRAKLRASPRDSEKEEEEVEEEENNDCVTKGRSMSLSNFFRVARNTMSMWYKNETCPEDVENEFWKVVTERQSHVVVHAGNIDSSVYQSGFPSNRNSPFSKHPWNLKVLTNNNNSILKCMGPVSGITIPTLHVGMLFTTGCWYRDPHSLPWIEYLHTGASKIWYGIPPNGCEKFREAMKKIMPECCTNNPIWLPSDTAMVPPDLLVKHGASLSRTVQNSGQFIVIFPGSFTSTICCGYCVSESVYFAPTPWLDLAQKAFQDIKSSCEPPAFSLERLLFSIANDPKTQPETLQKILPMIKNIRSQELKLRAELVESGLKQFERLPLLEVKDKKKKSRGIEDESEVECEICRTHCYVSMVVNTQEDCIYCLPHAVEHIQKSNLKLCKLTYTYNEEELCELVTKVSEIADIVAKSSSIRKKSPKKKISATPEKLLPH